MTLTQLKTVQETKLCKYPSNLSNCQIEKLRSTDIYIYIYIIIPLRNRFRALSTICDETFAEINTGLLAFNFFSQRVFTYRFWANPKYTSLPLFPICRIRLKVFYLPLEILLNCFLNVDESPLVLHVYPFTICFSSICRV